MIIGTFNTDNTDPKKCVPSLETKWVPEWDGNDKLPEKEQAYVIGRYLKPGDALKYQSLGREDGTATVSGWKYADIFRDTVKELHGFYWVDAKTGEQHELTKEAALRIPVTSQSQLRGDTLLMGWFQHIIMGESLNGDEQKNLDSASKPSA